MGNRVYKSWLKTVAKSPGKVAFTDVKNKLSVSFSQVQEAVEKRIDELNQIGPVNDRVIAFQVQNSTDWMSRFLACQALEAIALPVDPDVPAGAVASISSHVCAFATWTVENLRELNNATVRNPACLIKLTSGSTGDPRPLFFTDEQMLADGINVMRTMGISASDSNLGTIPFGHSYGLGNLVMPCIMKGCPVHICHDPFPHSIAATVKATQASIYPTVPAIIKALIRSDIDPGDLAGIRLWISAGSRLDANVAQAFRQRFSRSVHNFYGSSETGGIAYDRSGKDTQTGRSVGKPLAGVTVSLSASNRLIVESNAVFTRGNFRRNGPVGRYLLPDIAAILEDGSIRLEGRKARIVKLAGKRLSLVEVENALLNIDGIEAVYVDEYRDANGRTRVGSILVSALDPGTIKNHLKTSLAQWKIPSRWVFVDAMPVNPRGKLDRSKLQKLIRS